MDLLTTLQKYTIDTGSIFLLIIIHESNPFKVEFTSHNYPISKVINFDDGLHVQFTRECIVTYTKLEQKYGSARNLNIVVHAT